METSTIKRSGLSLSGTLRHRASIHRAVGPALLFSLDAFLYCHSILDDDLRPIFSMVESSCDVSMATAC